MRIKKAGNRTSELGYPASAISINTSNQKKENKLLSGVVNEKNATIPRVASASTEPTHRHAINRSKHQKDLCLLEQVLINSKQSGKKSSTNSFRPKPEKKLVAQSTASVTIGKFSATDLEPLAKRLSESDIRQRKDFPSGKYKQLLKHIECLSKRDQENEKKYSEHAISTNALALIKYVKITGFGKHKIGIRSLSQKLG